MRLSDTQLETLRTRPSQTALDLFVFKPRAILACQINNPDIAKGARTIAFDSVSNGSHVSVEPGMTLLVGSAPGLSDIGKIRVRTSTNAYIEVAENSNIKWADRLHLTVLRYWDLWTVFPRIIQDPNNDENVIFYKDYDIPYANQNFHLGTFVNAGSHRPVLLENGTGTAYYSSTGTYNLLDNPLYYDWSFEGGNPTGSSLAVPGYVSYTTPGDYVTRLIVTDAGSGNADTTYRYVSVRNKIGEGGNTPIVKWEMNSLSGSRDEGGYSAEFKIFSPEIDIDENCLIMLHARDWYGNTKQALGGNYPENGQTFFVGYIEKGSIHYNAFHSYVSFTAISVTGMMKNLTGFSVSVESIQNPASWYELRDMDCRRAIYHYLKWHSTILSVTDFSFVGDDRKIQFYDVDRTSVFDAIDNLMKSALVGRLSSDRQGRLWADIDPKAYDNPTGTFVPVMGITNRDWKNEPTIDENIYDKTSYIELGGIAYSGAVTGTFTALLSGAPGLAPSNHGNVEKMQGLALLSQEQLNQLSGNLWANRNQPYPTISMDMATPPRNLDIAPQEVVSIKLQESDTVRDAQIEGIYIPDKFSWSYSPKNQTLTSRVDYEGVVSGDPGDTILIPAAVEFGEFDFPEFSFPPFPPFAPFGLPIIDATNTQNLVIHVKDRGIFYTNNFDSVEPSWQSANINLELFPAIMRNFEVALNGSMAIQLGNDSVWTTSAPGTGWKKIFDGTYVQNFEGYPYPRNGITAGFGMDRRTGAILVLGSLIATIFSNNLVYSWVGDINGVSIASALDLIPDHLSSNFQRYFYITKGNNGWLATYDNANNLVSSLIISSMGSSASNEVSPIPGTTNLDGVTSMRATESGNYAVAKAKSGLLTSNDGISWVAITGTPVPYREALYVDRFESIITNNDGSQIVIASSQYNQGISRSLDGGTTWATGTFGSSGTTSVWYLGGNSYVYGGNSNVYMIEDLLYSTGSLNKTGNLGNLITGSFEVIAMRHY